MKEIFEITYADERFADIPIGPEPEDFISNESKNNLHAYWR
jgi:hypothetical protein